MRATLGRIALVMLVTVGLSGCSSGSGMFAWFKKKPSNTALSEAPKYNPATPSNPSLPSTGQNPNNSLSSVGSTAWPATNASAGATAASASQYQSPAPGYPPASYPSTAYSPARITP